VSGNCPDAVPVTRITILTYGSRGDVQPFVALGVGLQRAGHSVRLAAPEVFSEFVRGYGLDFAPLPGNPSELVQRLVEESQKRGSIVGPIRAIMGYAMPLSLEVMARCREACADADLILHSFLLTVVGHEAAVERGIPHSGVEPFPVFSSTDAFPSLSFPKLPFGGAYNRLTHHLFSQSFWQSNRVGYWWMRRDYRGRTHRDLPPLHRWPFGGKHPAPLLYPISLRVIGPARWPENVHITGYWFLDTPEWQPPADLLAFLADGPAPVYIGFGSTVAQGMERVSAAAVEALRQSGKRGVILGGWADIGKEAQGDDLFVIDSAPHDWLFPQMAAVVHHGGAGTTAAGLRAGVPSIITPFSSDQPFWGERVHALGVGPKPIPFKRVNTDNLAAAITQAVSDTAMRDRALALGECIRAEDGVGRAIRVIEGILRSNRD
jgi:sterol 3beta-glucosyltransferase